MPVKIKVAKLRSESLGNALAAKVQSLAEPASDKVFPRPILASSSSEPRPGIVRASSELRSEPRPNQATLKSRETLDEPIASLIAGRRVCGLPLGEPAAVRADGAFSATGPEAEGAGGGGSG